MQPMSGWTIRAAGPEDARAIAEVHVRAWRHAYRGQLSDATLDGLSVDERQEVWTSAMARSTPRHGVLVAEQQGRGIVGFSGFGPTFDGDRTEETGEVYAIYIEPDLIGTGLGRDLFTRTREELRARGFSVATLWVLETNELARRFYEKAGWKHDGAVKQERIDWESKPTVRYVSALS